jgi:hypothetical protein
MGLAVEIDGVPIADEEEARALWERFSAWMEEHRGDLSGFAAQEGYASAHPGIANGRPILRLSRTAKQQPYATVRETGSDHGVQSRSRAKPGGSRSRNAPRHLDRPPARNPKK